LVDSVRPVPRVGGGSVFGRLGLALVGPTGTDGSGGAVGGVGAGREAAASRAIGEPAAGAVMGVGSGAVTGVGSGALVMGGALVASAAVVAASVAVSGIAARASVRASMSWKRSFGSLARHFSKRASTASGMLASGATLRGEGGGFCRCIDTRRIGFASTNGGLPVSSS
jgi:hypothetical protein